MAGWGLAFADPLFVSTSPCCQRPLVAEGKVGFSTLSPLFGPFIHSFTHSLNPDCLLEHPPWRFSPSGFPSWLPGSPIVTAFIPFTWLPCL